MVQIVLQLYNQTDIQQQGQMCETLQLNNPHNVTQKSF